jgi:hypothetical protein
MTPTPALRRRIAARIGELEQEIDDRRECVKLLAKQAADAPPTEENFTRALARLPLFPKRLSALPQRELRALFDSLHLQIVVSARCSHARCGGDTRRR